MNLDVCNPATRAWCLYEWTYTIYYHGPDGLHMTGMKPSDLARILPAIDVEKAECFDGKDKEMILRKIKEHHGSTTAFDSALKLQLLLRPLSYTVGMDGDVGDE